MWVSQSRCEGLLLEGHVGCHSFVGIETFAIRIIIMSINISQFLTGAGCFLGWAADRREFPPALCCALGPPRSAITRFLCLDTPSSL